MECECAGIGRQARLRGVCCMTYGFKSHLPHQQRAFERIESFFVCLKSSTRMGLEEAVVNQATVWPESGADRAASIRENPVLFPAPKKKARQKCRASDCRQKYANTPDT